MSEQTKNLSCDRRRGKDGIFHYDPELEVMLEASDFNMTPAAIEKAKSGKKAAEGLESLAEMMGKAKDRKLDV